MVFPLLTPGKLHRRILSVPLHQEAGATEIREKLNDFRFPDTFGRCPHFLTERASKGCILSYANESQSLGGDRMGQAARKIKVGLQSAKD